MGGWEVGKEIAMKSCWIRHDWGMWEQYNQNRLLYPGILAPKKMQDRLITHVDKRQKRICKRCNKMQDELVSE